MRNYKAHGVVIKRRNFGEGDKILTVLTEHHGKIDVLAKGVRKITSRRGPSVELFNQTSFFLHKAKFLDIVTEAVVINGFERMRNDLLLISHAYQMCELVDFLTREQQKHQDVFHLLISYLHQVNTGARYDIQLFKQRLLVMLGFLAEPEAVDQNLDERIEQIAQRRLHTRRIYE